MLEKNAATSKLSTDSLLVNVGYSPVDSTGRLRDIKPVIEVTVTDYTWLYIAGAVLGVLLIIVLLYYYFRNRKRKPKPVFHAALSPYDEAMKALDELKGYDLGKPEQVKAYHVLLTEIFRRYYSRKANKDLLSKTTSEILVSVKEQYHDQALLSSLSAGLRSADAVKFAKYLPGAAETGAGFMQVKESIELIEKKQS